MDFKNFKTSFQGFSLPGGKVEGRVRRLPAIGQLVEVSSNNKQQTSSSSIISLLIIFYHHHHIQCRHQECYHQWWFIIAITSAVTDLYSLDVFSLSFSFSPSSRSSPSSSSLLPSNVVWPGRRWSRRKILLHLPSGRPRSDFSIVVMLVMVMIVMMTTMMTMMMMMMGRWHSCIRRLFRE